MRGTRSGHEFHARLRLAALHDANGVVAHAAEKLQVRRTTLAEKMKRYGM